MSLVKSLRVQEQWPPTDCPTLDFAFPFVFQLPITVQIRNVLAIIFFIRKVCVFRRSRGRALAENHMAEREKNKSKQEAFHCWFVWVRVTSIVWRYGTLDSPRGDTLGCFREMLL